MGSLVISKWVPGKTGRLQPRYNQASWLAELPCQAPQDGWLSGTAGDVSMVSCASAKRGGLCRD